MRNELGSIVLKTQVIVSNFVIGIGMIRAKSDVTVVVEDGEFVLDALPGGEIGGVLVAVLPDGAPAGEDGGRGGGFDFVGRGEAALENTGDHEGVGLLVESVELGGEVGERGDFRN